MSQINTNTIANELGTGGPDFVGMPSVGGDPVVESGSNTDGEWTRWADGTQQCVGGLTAPDSTGIGKKSATWTFPIAFVDINRKVFCAFQFNTAANMDRARWLYPDNLGVLATSQVIGWYEGAWVSADFGGSQVINLSATGRWK